MPDGCFHQYYFACGIKLLMQYKREPVAADQIPENSVL
jgi:hypothetical protein